ncbi:MAG: hypothetical protein WCB88_05760, partial [Azonexus sp.]
MTVQEIFPQSFPDRPIVPTGKNHAGGWRKTVGNLFHAAGKAVFAAVTDEDLEIDRRLSQPAPNPELRICQFIGCRLPPGQTTGAGDGVGRQATARIRRQQAKAVDMAWHVGAAGERQQSAERNPAQPDFLVTVPASRFE